MKMKNIIFLFFLLILCIACNDKETISYTPPKFEKTVNVKVEIIDGNYLLNYPEQPILMDSLLLFKQDNNSDIIQIYNKNNFEFIKSFLNKGKANNEVIGVQYLSVNNENSILYINDYQNKKIISFDVNKVLCDTIETTHQITKLNGTIADCYEILFLTDSLFFGTNKSGFIISTATKERCKYDNFIFDKSIFKDKDEWIKFQNTMPTAVSPDGKMIVKASYIGGILEIYEISNDSIKLKNRKNFYKPIYEKDSNTPFNNETIFVFRELCITSNYIYATVHAESNITQLPNKIWKFDLNGDPICEYKCGYPIMDFVVDEEQQIIYSFVSNSEGDLKFAKLYLNE